MTDYKHLTTDELIRWIGAQAGDDLELEGELIRRVRADEIRFFESDPLEELQSEVEQLETAVAARDDENEALTKKIDKAASMLMLVHMDLKE